MTSRSARDRAPLLRGLALGGLAVGAVLALVAGSRAWWRAAGTGVSVAFSGTDATAGLAQALALVVLAGALLGLALRSRGRQVLGVLLVLAGAGVVVVGVSHPRPASSAVQSKVLEVSLADQFALLGTAWPYVYGVAGLVVVAAAGLMTATAGRWPSRAARFERPGAGQTAPAGQTSSGGAVATGPLTEDDPAVLWRQLDAGVDPTAAEDPHPSERAVVHEQPSGVTMNPRAPARTDEPT